MKILALKSAKLAKTAFWNNVPVLCLTAIVCCVRWLEMKQSGGLCICICMCLWSCMYVCAWERERERERLLGNPLHFRYGYRFSNRPLAVLLLTPNDTPCQDTSVFASGSLEATQQQTMPAFTIAADEVNAKHTTLSVRQTSTNSARGKRLFFFQHAGLRRALFHRCIDLNCQRWSSFVSAFNIDHGVPALCSSRIGLFDQEREQKNENILGRVQSGVMVFPSACARGLIGLWRDCQVKLRRSDGLVHRWLVLGDWHERAELLSLYLHPCHHHHYHHGLDYLFCENSIGQ